MQKVCVPRAEAEGPPVLLALPLLPGQSEQWRRFLQELQASRREAFDAACRRWGIGSLTLWLAPARAGDLVLVQFVPATDVADAEERFVHSRHPFDLWIAERARTLHGADLRHGVARYRTELLGVWPQQAQPTAHTIPVASAHTGAADWE